MSYRLVTIDTGEVIRMPEELYVHMMSDIRAKMGRNEVPTSTNYVPPPIAAILPAMNPEYVARREPQPMIIPFGIPIGRSKRHKHHPKQLSNDVQLPRQISRTETYGVSAQHELSKRERQAVEDLGSSDIIELLKKADRAQEAGELGAAARYHRNIQDHLRVNGIIINDYAANKAFAMNSAIMHNAQSVSKAKDKNVKDFNEIFFREHTKNGKGDFTVRKKFELK